MTICWLKRVTVVSINFLTTAVRQAQLAPTSCSRAAENFRFSTADYCTVELASAAKLMQYSLRSLIKETKVIFHMTRHEQAVVRPTAIILSPSPTSAANNYSFARVLGDKHCSAWCSCMAINVSVQYNSEFLPDIILLTQCYYHRGTRLNAMKKFCLCSLCSHLNILTFLPPSGGCSKGLDAFKIFL